MSRDAARKGLAATVEIDVTDSKGASVCHVNRPLAELTWADPEGGRDTYGLYQLEESSFQPRTGERYQIRIRYTPDAKLTCFKGFAHIRCGGSI